MNKGLRGAHLARHDHPRPGTPDRPAFIQQLVGDRRTADNQHGLCRAHPQGIHWTELVRPFRHLDPRSGLGDLVHVAPEEMSFGSWWEVAVRVDERDVVGGKGCEKGEDWSEKEELERGDVRRDEARQW